MKIYLLLPLLCLMACTTREPAKSKVITQNSKLTKYARLLTLTDKGAYVEAAIKDPWDTTRLLARYEIRERLRRVAVASSVHCSLLDELGAFRNIIGVMDSRYIRHEGVKEALRRGRLRDFGDARSPSLEALLDAHPDALLLSPFEHNERLRCDIPVIECADYMETSPLGRAEWIKFYGLLFGQRERADSIFQAVEHDYLALKRKAAKTRTRPTIVGELPYRGVWYVAAGGSTVGQLYADAGARYIFADVEGTGSQPMAVEQAFERAQKADLWLVKYDRSTPLRLEDIASDHPLLARMRARVYGCNTRFSTYYEDTPFHPERLLQEVLAITHPELHLKGGLYYHALTGGAGF